VAQTVVDPAYYAEVTHTVKPHLNLRTFLAYPTRPQVSATLAKGSCIDIHKTHIIDTNSGVRRYALLSSIIYGIGDSNNLLMRTNMKFADGDHPDGEIFDFKWSEDYDLWAAGTAFLRDES
jgi:hypothetical protein